MKKFFGLVFIFNFVMLFPLRGKALTYNSYLTGGNTLYARGESYNENVRLHTSLGINITNLEDIGYFEMYVDYDNNLVGLSNCNLFNYAGSGCYITSDKKIYHIYKYTDGYTEYFNKYNFYTITFMPKDATPSTGNTKVHVMFRNAKDKNGNDITITPSTKDYNFLTFGFKINTSDKDVTIENDDSNVENKDINDDSVDTLEDNDTFNTENSSKNAINGNDTIIDSDNKTDNDAKKNKIVDDSSKIVNNNVKNKKKDKQIRNSEMGNKDSNKVRVNKTMKKYLIIGSSCLIFLIIIIAIMNHQKNKKLDQIFEEF